MRNLTFLIFVVFAFGCGDTTKMVVHPCDTDGQSSKLDTDLEKDAPDLGVQKIDTADGSRDTGFRDSYPDADVVDTYDVSDVGEVDSASSRKIELTWKVSQKNSYKILKDGSKQDFDHYIPLATSRFLFEFFCRKNLKSGRFTLSYYKLKSVHPLSSGGFTPASKMKKRVEFSSIPSEFLYCHLEVYGFQGDEEKWNSIREDSFTTFVVGKVDYSWESSKKRQAKIVDYGNYKKWRINP